jgi:outer membrane immunogenic protein
MKKLVLALTAVAAFTGSAVAADLPSRTYTKAPMMAAAPSWTGFYIFGGGGYGMWNSDTNAVNATTGVALTNQQRMGADGYFGTAGIGYDWQFNQSWVAGVFADGQFGSIRGTIQDPLDGVNGTEKNRTNAAAGVRLGYLVAPSVLSYVNAGYSYAQFSGSTLAFNNTGAPVAATPSFNRNGWFVGGGVENQLNVFGFSPGWFMKTEYRVAEYDRVTLPETFLTGGATGVALSTKPIVQTVSTALVYRFNWTGPVVAKY